jgi:hypothetical protein
MRKRETNDTFENDFEGCFERMKRQKIIKVKSQTSSSLASPPPFGVLGTTILPLPSFSREQHCPIFSLAPPIINN